MQFEIIYLFHNCFLLKTGDRVFLFDYPADKFLDHKIQDQVLETIKDTELFVVNSHVHQDHFNHNIGLLSNHATTTSFILSSDIVKRYSRLKKLPGVFIVQPDQEYQIADLQLTTFKSTDQGVAFLIRLNNVNIFFGGDLANWNWDELNPRAKSEMEETYAKFLAKLSQWPIQIAFVNTDQRLPNWAGAAEFLTRINPDYFIPMHTFGETATLSQFISQIKEPHQIFQYHDTGDVLQLNI